MSNITLVILKVYKQKLNPKSLFIEQNAKS